MVQSRLAGGPMILRNTLKTSFFFNMWGGVSLPRVLIGLYIVEMVHFDSNGRKAKHVHFVSFCPNLLDTVNICRCPAVSEIRAGVTIESKYQNALSSLF